MAAFAFRTNQTDGIDALAVASENSLVQSLGEAFFLTGSVDSEQLPDTLEVIRVAFEDGGASDDVITEACQHAEHALVDFLLAVVCSNRSDSAVAARCLAFAGNVYEDMWINYCADAHHMCKMLTACKTIPDKVNHLNSLNSTHVRRRSSYLGYDPRDKADYNMEGYDEEEVVYQQEVSAKSQRQDHILVYLLLCSQFFHQQHFSMGIYVQNNRDFGNLVDMETVGDCLDTLCDACGEDATVLDHVMISVLLYISRLFNTIACSVFEDASQLCVKITIAINAQFPVMEDTTEIAREFIVSDCQEASEGKLTKALLYILNENGYPNMVESEAIAACSLCIHLLSDTVAYQSMHQTGHMEVKGHFYTNDIKVLLEVCLRELTNIPGHDHFRLRMRYVQLLEAILAHSCWATSGERYLVGSIREMVNTIAEHDPQEASRYYALEILDKHGDVLAE